MSVRTPRCKSSPRNNQEHYIRARDDQFFDGMRSRNSVLNGRTHSIDIQESVANENIFIDLSVNNTYSLQKLSLEDPIVEPHDQSSSKKWSEISKLSSSQSTNNIAMNNKFEEEVNLRKFNSITGELRETFILSKKSYIVKKGSNDLKIQLPPSAASFYVGNNPSIEISQLCEGITKLNMYLNEKKEEVKSGISGKFLHAVLGQDLHDIGSVVSTILYAFYLNETLGFSHLCTVPVINMKRADFDSHIELKWLLNSCHMDHLSLVFIDEIDLSYYNLSGRLRLVLLNGDRLPEKQEEDPGYSWVQNVTIGQECSSCAFIAEKFLLILPHILDGQGFSRLLLAGILFDTENLTNAKCVTMDKYMATLLLTGAGRYGCDVRYKMHDVSSLKVKDILRKGLKKWTAVGKPDGKGLRLTPSHLGMSCTGMPIGKLLAHDGTSLLEIANFQRKEKLCLLMVVSGYYDSQKNFKREILVCTEHDNLMENLLLLFKSNSSQLPLKDLDIPGLGGEMRAFEIDRVVSRKRIERVLEEFSTPLKYQR